MSRLKYVSCCATGVAWVFSLIYLFTGEFWFVFACLSAALVATISLSIDDGHV